MTHTQCPLTVRRSPSKHEDYVVITERGHIVAECFSDIREFGENATAEALANAHLYAASPRMLNALRIAEAALTLAFIDGECDPEGRYAVPLSQVRAAIVMATGEGS